jgi:hypothetical protein
MLPSEAKTVWNLPITWRARLEHDNFSADEVHQEVLKTVGELKGQYGESDYWDRMLLAMAESFIASSEFEKASELLARADNLEVVVERAVAIVTGSVRRGSLGPESVTAFTNAMFNAFYQAGRIEELSGAGFADLNRRLEVAFEPTSAAFLRVSATDLGEKPDFEPELQPEISYEEAIEIYPHAPWQELGPLADNDQKWPEEMDVEKRFRVVVDFGVMLHETVEDTEVDRKAAEALKAFIEEGQAGRGGEAWDIMRFIAAVKLYDRNGARFGRIFARNMDDQEMSAMVAYALLERKRDSDAMAVLEDLRDKELHGRMLVLGEWQEPEKVAALIEDLTQVTPRTRRKHDPQLRLGVARGVHAVYASFVEEGATTWADRAEVMRKRAELLARQINMKYI